MAGVLDCFSQCTITLTTQQHNTIQSILSALKPQRIIIGFTALIIIVVLQLVCACVSLCLLVYYKKHFNIDRTGEHALKLIYQVLEYAWKHK